MYEVKIAEDVVLRRCIILAVSDFIGRDRYDGGVEYRRDDVSEMLWDDWKCGLVLHKRPSYVTTRIEIRSVMFRNESAYTWFLLRWS